MKNTHTHSSIYSICLLFVALSGCHEDRPTNIPGVRLDHNLVRNREIYDNGVKERATHDGAFVIDNLVRDDRTLKVFVRGGCADSFTFVWDGRVAESYPLQAWLLLTNQADESCNADVIHELTLDLTRLQISPTDLDICVFHVANASLKQDLSIDLNGIVTSK